MKRTIKVPAELFRDFGRAEKREDGTMRLSISSDEPYLRYDWMADEEYYEVLDHSPSGVDTSRISNGTALLFNHKRDVQLGTINTPTLEGGRCYVSAKMSDAEDVKGYKQRVDEGILKDTSIGYNLLDEGVCTGEKNGIPVYKFRFAINEASLVTIPADMSVGVGRQRSTKDAEGNEIKFREIVIDDPTNKEHKQTTPTRSMPETETPTKPEVKVTAPDPMEAVRNYKAKCGKIDAYVEGLRNPSWKSAAQKIADKFKAQDDPNFEDFRAEAVQSFEGLIRVDDGMTAEIGMDEADLRRYSLARAIYLRGTGKPLDGLEKECSDETAKRLKKEADGFFIPEDVMGSRLAEVNKLSRTRLARENENLERVLRMAYGANQRTLLAGNFVSAGALIGTDLLAGSLIELLRNKQLFTNLGTTMLSGLVGNIAIPRQTGGATAYWLAEGGAVTESDQTFSQVGMTPHRLVAQTAYDKQLVAQSSISIEAMVRNDIALVMAIKKDLAILQGAGNSGEPLGILNTTGVQTVTFGGATTFAKILEFETDLATANADQTGTPVFLTSPTVRGKWKGTGINLTGATTVSSAPLWDWKDNRINGYAGFVSNQVPSSGPNANLVYFGVPSEVIDAMWAGIDVVVNPFSLDSTGQIRTTITQYCDLALRHSPAWVVSTDSGAQ